MDKIELPTITLESNFGYMSPAGIIVIKCLLFKANRFNRLGILIGLDILTIYN